jgi:hypothetical protein
MQKKKGNMQTVQYASVTLKALTVLGARHATLRVVRVIRFLGVFHWTTGFCFRIHGGPVGPSETGCLGPSGNGLLGRLGFLTFCLVAGS